MVRAAWVMLCCVAWSGCTRVHEPGVRHPVMPLLQTQVEGLVSGVELPRSARGEAPPRDATVVVVTGEALRYLDADGALVELDLSEPGVTQGVDMDTPASLAIPLVAALRDQAAREVVVVADASAPLDAALTALVSVQLAGVEAPPMLAVAPPETAGAGIASLRVLRVPELGIPRAMLEEARTLTPADGLDPGWYEPGLEIFATGEGVDIAEEGVLIEPVERCADVQPAATLCPGGDALELRDVVAARASSGPVRFAASYRAPLGEALARWDTVSVAVASADSPATEVGLTLLEPSELMMLKGTGPVGLAESAEKEGDGLYRLHSRAQSLYGTGGPEVDKKMTAISGAGERIIRTVVRQHRHDIQRCHEEAWMQDPTLEGRVEIRFTIGADGRVTKATVVSNTASETVGRCLSQRLSGWRFPPPRDTPDVTVTYPFELSR